MGIAVVLAASPVLDSITMKFFILASLLALAVAEPDHHMKNYGNGVVAPEKTPSVKALEALHFNAKANAEMYKAQMPYFYYGYQPVVYHHGGPHAHHETKPTAVKEVDVKAQPVVQQVQTPVVTYTQPIATAPVTYTHPVTYTTHHQSMVYQYPTVYGGYHHLAKREAEAEAEADPYVFYQTHGYYPSWYTGYAGYTHQVAPVVYTQPKVQGRARRIQGPTTCYLHLPYCSNSPRDLHLPYCSSYHHPTSYTSPSVPRIVQGTLQDFEPLCRQERVKNHFAMILYLPFYTILPSFCTDSNLSATLFGK